MIACAHCGSPVAQSVGAINKALRIGAPLYCNRVCFGLHRRQNKTAAQKVEEKRLYDLQYRAKNLERIKADKRAYFVRTYDPAKAAIERAKNMPKHVEYCRQPKYKAYKKDYDSAYRAEKDYGEFAESFLMLQKVQQEVDSRATDSEIHLFTGTINKALQRRRHYEKLTGKHSVRR